MRILIPGEIEDSGDIDESDGIADGRSGVVVC